MQMSLSANDLRDVFDAASKVYELFEDPTQWVQKKYHVQSLGSFGGIYDPIPGYSSNIAAKLTMQKLGWQHIHNIEHVLPTAESLWSAFMQMQPSEEFSATMIEKVNKAFRSWVPKLQDLSHQLLPRAEAPKPKEQYCSIGAVEFVMPKAVQAFRAAMYHYCGIEYVEYFNDNHTLAEIRETMLKLGTAVRADLENGIENIVLDSSKLRLDRNVGNWHYCE